MALENLFADVEAEFDAAEATAETVPPPRMEEAPIALDAPPAPSQAEDEGDEEPTADSLSFEALLKDLGDEDDAGEAPTAAAAPKVEASPQADDDPFDLSGLLDELTGDAEAEPSPPSPASGPAGVLDLSEDDDLDSLFEEIQLES